MEREVKKLLDAQIIIPLRYSDWIANLVPVRKKMGKLDSVWTLGILTSALGKTITLFLRWNIFYKG
jgi:hypothetical protein